MYKVENNRDSLVPYHNFMCDILKALRISLRENNNYTIEDLAENLESINPLVNSFINRGGFLDNVYKLKNSPVDLCKEYGKFVKRYKRILDGKWKGKSELANEVNKEIKNVFIFFYEKLVGYITFNKVYFKTSNSLGDFRAKMSLNSVCPYCDIAKTNKEVVSVDHFLPKKSFPILSIYPDNLVVSCKGCNENVKGERIKTPIAHPYYDEIADYFIFVIDDSDSEKFKIDIRMNSQNSSLINKKVENFIDLFEIKERYETDMTAELQDFRSQIRKTVLANLSGIAKFRPISLTDIKVSTETYFDQAIIDNKQLYRAANGTKIKNDYIAQIIEEKAFQADVDYLKSHFEGLGSIFK